MQTEKKQLKLERLLFFNAAMTLFRRNDPFFQLTIISVCFSPSVSKEFTEKNTIKRRKEGESLLTKMTSPNNNTAAQQHNLASMNFMASSSTPDDKNGICNNPLEVGGSSSSFFIPGLRPLYPLHPGTYPYSLLSPSEMSQFSPW